MSGPRFLHRDLQAAFAHAARREAVGKRAAPCPACGSRQVQLTDSVPTPAQWKCRACKRRFTYEPPENAP